MFIAASIAVITMWSGCSAWKVQTLSHPLWRGFVTIGTGLTLSSLAFDTNTIQPYSSFVNVASADSTGKFSTKLTARKRYLPRVIAGYQRFANLRNDATLINVKQFLDEDLPTLQRAMNLYGLSLRKGEVPDEISRKAEALTDAFAKEAKELLSAKNLPVQLERCQAALDEYVSFAKIDVSTAGSAK